ncbi:hypothetical protein C8Q74DRAFT_1278827 [Fomes fomentarius]|nr:hypothetical protein C8Q74DRAFT_1278827 [Fomes fomentarius]
MDEHKLRENEVHAEEEDGDLLADYFEKSASAVRDSFGRFEQDVARPLVDYVLVSFRKRPIRSTFITFYLALSALPVLSFIGFSIFVFATFIFLGLATAIFGAAFAVGFFGFWLACTLIFFLFLSFNLTVSALATYLVVRFVLRARQDGARIALSALAQDARAQFVVRRGRRTLIKGLQGEQEGALEEQVKTEREREGSDQESLVLVGDPSSRYGEKVPGVPVDASV